MLQGIYRILDRVIETGEPVIIERNGRRVRIVADEVPARLDTDAVVWLDTGQIERMGRCDRPTRFDA